MRGREYLIDPEHAPHTPIALFDEHGKLHGWSPTFADDCAPSAVEFRIASDRRLLAGVRRAFAGPRSGARRKSTARPPIVQVLARNKQCEHSEIDRARDRSLPRAATRRLRRSRYAGRRRGVCDCCSRICSRRWPAACRSKASWKRFAGASRRMAPSVICSVLAVDREQQLRHIASPSLPQHYSNAIDGLLIGPKAGSCGTAAFRGEPVEVTDIATDPLWEDYKHLALPLGPARMLVEPHQGRRRRVIGAFAFYYPRPRGPTRSNGRSWRRASTSAPSPWSMRRRARAPTSRHSPIR